MRPIPITRRAALLGTLTAAAAPVEPGIALERVNGHCLVSVLLDGHLARMVLDTGAGVSIVTRGAAARLGLPADPWVSSTLRGASGLLERHANVDVGVARAGAVRLFQQPGRGLSLPVTSSDLGGADGLLGGDVLQHYDIDLDIPNARLLLGAPGPAPPASETVHLQLLRRTLLLAPVTLDGHALLALVDTGAGASILNARGLYRLGLLAPQDDKVVTLQTVGGIAPARLHRFTEFRIGKLSIAKPTLITQTVPNAAYDLVLGLDVLARQRLRLSYATLTLQFAATGP